MDITDTLPTRRIAVMAKLREVQRGMRRDAEPQNYSYERRSRALWYVERLPVIDATVTAVAGAKTRGEARAAVRAALHKINTGIECNMLHRALDMVG